MQERQINKPVKLNLDASLKYLPNDSAFYLLNHERNILGTGTLGKSTPMAANYLACEMEPMEGTPYGVGTYRSPLTNEVYQWVYNDGGINYILRLNGDGTCQVVYSGECLQLSADPKHSIEQWRAYMKYDKLCAHRHGKQLIWTDGINEIGMIDVEASIATDSFTTAFFEVCPDECAPIQMCVGQDCGLLEGEFIPLDAADVDLNNYLVDIAVQVMYRYHYYDERVSEWMGRSTLFYQDSRNCFDNTEGFPRCIKFRVPVGNPLVDRIEIAVRRNNELGTDGISPQWYSTDLVEKYEPYSSQSQYWYERELADLLNFSETDCAFDYIFCNDKKCNPISFDETNRVYNPLPREAQGLIPIKNSLGFYNYLKGTCPLDGTEVEKFEIGLDCDNNVCNAELVDVTVYAIVQNMWDNRNGFVYRNGGNSATAPDDLAEKARFGRGNLNNDSYGTEYKDKTRNFIVYIEGTDYWSEMVQWKATPNFTTSAESGIVSGMSDLVIRGQVVIDIENGNFYVQKGVIKVPKGTRGFLRIASQKSTDGLDSNQDTSTYVLGTIPDIHSYTGTTDLASAIERNFQEVYFDTCAGSVELNETLIIDDQYVDFSTGNHSSSAYSGYITDANNQPVPSAEVWYNGSIKALSDYNGFYHFYLYGGVNGTISAEIRVEQGCVGGFTNVKSLTINSGYSLATNDYQITNTNAPNYATDFYEIFVVVVKDCNNAPVAGVRVALFGQKYEVTNVSGTATFHVRNYSTRDKRIRAVVINENGCFTLNCAGGCDPCNPVTANTLLSACFSGTPYLAVLTDNKLNTASSTDNQKGLKAGGRFPFGFVVKWKCGKISPVYPATILTGSLPQDDNYLNVPKTQEKERLSFCNLTYRGNGITLPDGASCLAIVRGENVNPFELQWVVDDFERTSDGKIKITIQSLNDYNATYNFQTNTVYQFIPGDRVEFIANGDGVIFDTATYGLLNFQILSPYHDKVISGEDNAPANFFNQILIDDDGSLQALVKGAKIELQRPKECEVQTTYKEVYNIPIDANGHLVDDQGTFLTFDTFFINRKIGKSAAQIFEHHSPSDHWGNRLGDGGLVFFENPFENEKRFGRNITINLPTHYNIFGYIEKTIDGAEQGDITSMGLYDEKIGIAIAEHDNFRFQVSDDLARIGGDGLLHAAPPDSVISDAEPKVSGRFGCQYAHIGSIYYGDGFINFWDVNKAAWIKHDFQNARDVSINKAKLYFSKRGQFIETFNETAVDDIHKFRPIIGYNTHTGAVILTVKALNQGGVNNEDAMFAITNDTILFEPLTEDFLTMASFTGERYSNIDLFDGNGCAFVSFQNGLPYVHPKIPIKYNEFYSVPVDWYVGISINQQPDIIKVPDATEIQSEDMFFIKKVTTDKVGFESEVPAIRFKKTERKWNASYLFDKNSRGGIFGRDSRVAGTPARGYYIAVLYIRDNTIGLVYNSTNPTKMTSFGELDFILNKYQYSAQSGMNENR